MGFVGGLGTVNVDLIYSDMDRLPALGEEVYARSFGLYLGGGIPATLVNLGRLGLDARLLTFLGEDMFSAFARGALESSGAKVVNLQRGADMPVVVTSVMTLNGDRAFMSYGQSPTPDAAMLDRAFEALRGADVVAMQPGALPLYQRLKSEGTRLVFDTGWEDDLSLSKYAETLKLADYYLPNRREAMKITGTDSPEAAARALADWLPSPMVKLDREGCLYWKDGGPRVVPPLPHVDVVDATGAGDAFMAGFIYGLAQHCDVERCIQYGNITGAACVQAVGCLTGWVSEEALIGQWKRHYA